MNKELLISIKPEHLVSILNGKKTLELRKTVPKDYKGWIYIYCTKGGKGLFKDNDYFLFNNGNSSLSLNGKVVARFWFDEYDEIKYIYAWHGDYKINGREMQNGDYLKLQLNYYQLNNYLGLYKKATLRTLNNLKYLKNQKS